MTSYASLASGTSHKNTVFLTAVILGFILLTAWFKTALPYDHYFFVSTLSQRLLHIAARVAFTAYLFVILFGAGQWLLRGITLRTGAFTLSACEEIAISALAGSSVIRITMLCLGFANLYSFGLMLVLAVLALAGASRLPLLLRMPGIAADANCATRMTHKVLLGILALAITTVLIGKGIYPNGTGDYFTHYFHYYLHVIQSGGLEPNDVWYHFYISKGFGDVFFAMILSDPLGPLCVSFVMYLTGIALGYAFLKRMTQDTLVSLLVSVMIASAYICTYEKHIGFHDWAEFSKQHVITAVLFFGITWATWMLQELPADERKTWANVIAVIIAGLIIARPQFAAICDIYLALLGAIALFRRSPLLRSYIFLACVASFTALLMLAINYWITGVAEVTPFPVFWKFADQERFSHWVSPFLWLLLELATSVDISTALGSAHHHSPLVVLAIVLRLSLIAPYAIPLLLCIILREPTLWTKRCHYRPLFPPAFLRGLISVLALLLAATILFISGHQVDSTFRLYVFCIYPVMILATVPFAILHRVSHNAKITNAATIGIMLMGVFVFLFAIHQNHYKEKWSWKNISFSSAEKFLERSFSNKEKEQWTAFAMGQSSIADAYSEQKQGFLWKPGITACKQVAPDTRIWSSQITGPLFESPHCRFETFMSYSMGTDYAAIHFEDADTAETLLKKQKLDYFLIDTNAPFFDILPYSPLFLSNEIGKHLGVAWSENGVYLLTWKSAHTKPLPPEFYTGYQKSLKSALGWADFPALYASLHGYYLNWKKDPHWPVNLDPAAHRPRGWQ